MQVGIIGAGNVGAALARASARARHGVFISLNDGAEQGVAREVGDGLNGKVLIDVTNRFTGDQLGAPSNAEQIQRRWRRAPGS